MILEKRFSPRVSVRAVSIVAMMALFVFPLSFEARHDKASAAPQVESAPVRAQNPKTGASSEFPHVVDFEQGASKFEEGDDITILEIRGTAEKFTPGHIYWIRGKYKLASHKKATLAAYTTAMDAENGSNPSFKVQHLDIEEGEGTFTLFLPMWYRGWPHVSLYADDRSSFGGNYFGTGDSVLKRWWGSKDTEKSTINISRDGNIEFDRHVLADVSELTRRLTEARRRDPGLSLVVRADGDARHQRVVDVLNACEKAGVNSVSIDR